MDLAAGHQQAIEEALPADHAAILQVTNANPAINDTIVHNNGIVSLFRYQ